MFIWAGAEHYKTFGEAAVGNINSLSVKIRTFSFFGIVKIIFVRVGNNADNQFLVFCQTNADCAVLKAFDKIRCPVNRVYDITVAVRQLLVIIALLAENDAPGVILPSSSIKNF